MINATFSTRRLFLFIIPLYTLVVSVIFINKFSPFYHSEPDPCYSYLFNGMNLAGGNMELGHVDHPGTTVQCFAATVIFTKHFLMHSATPLSHDVITNAEDYLLTCSIILIILFISINYLTGVYVYRHTKSIGLSMLFQITPLININIIQRAIVLDSESFIILAANIFMAYLFVNAPENNAPAEKPLRNRKVIVFGIFSGLLIASKYTCVPVLFLVLFVLKNNKQRLIYFGATVLSFFIFIIPALPKLGNMFRWISGIATHDGIYGKGEERIINPSQYLNNLQGIMLTDTIFTAFYGIITVAFIYALVKRVKKTGTVPFFCTITGVWVSITLLILAVAKHTEFHYLIFAECCFPLGLAVSYKILSASLVSFSTNYNRHRKVIIYSFFSALCIFLVIEKIRYMPFHPLKKVGISKYLDKYKDIPIVISIKDGLACERKEPALYLGYLYSGNLQSQYSVSLNNIYPNTYIYWNNSQSLTHWSEGVSIAELLNKNKSVIVYTKGYNDSTWANIIHRFENGKQGQYSEQEIFKDAETLQSVCLITNTKVFQGL